MAHYPYPQHRIRPFLLRKEKSRNRHIFLTLHSIIYGFSRFANGILVDRFSKKKIMSIGAGLVVALCGFMLDHFGYSAWYLCFLIPALIALVGVPILWFGLKDDPTEVGLPPIEKMTAQAEQKGDSQTSRWENPTRTC